MDLKTDTNKEAKKAEEELVDKMTFDTLAFAFSFLGTGTGVFTTFVLGLLAFNSSKDFNNLDQLHLLRVLILLVAILVSGKVTRLLFNIMRFYATLPKAIKVYD